MHLDFCSFFPSAVAEGLGVRPPIYVFVARQHGFKRFFTENLEIGRGKLSLRSCELTHGLLVRVGGVDDHMKSKCRKLRSSMD